jgi:hypothetical protein
MRRISTKREVFISTHPERYGYGNDPRISSVVVVEQNGRVKAAHPAQSYKVATRIYTLIVKVPKRLRA